MDKHTPTPWTLWTSNSHRRVMSEKGPVLHGTLQTDGTSDLVFSNPDDAEFMIHAVNRHDDAVRALEMAAAMLSLFASEGGAKYQATRREILATLLRIRTPGDWVALGDVARDICDMQAQYASHYVDGRHPGTPNLGQGLRFRGRGGRTIDTADYHNIEVHKDDIITFANRINQHGFKP